VRDSQAHAAALAEELREAQAHADSVAEALRGSQAQAETVTQQLREAQARAETVTQQLREAQARAERVTRAWHESQANSARLAESLREAETQAADYAARMHGALQRTWQARDRIEASHERADNLDHRIAEQAREYQQAQAEIETLRAALAKAQLDGHQVSEWARGLEQRVVDIGASTSWRVTGPLRAAGALLHGLRQPALARRVLARLTANERLRRLFIPVLLRHPTLRRQVEAKLVAIKHAPGDGAPDETRDLPVSVRGVLADLQRARGKPPGS
jgi:hypothetical protein